MTKFTLTTILCIGISLLLLTATALGYQPAWILFVITLFFYSLIVFGGVVNVSWQFFMPVICRLPNHGNEIFLTFDDGPHQNTTEILNLLEKYEAKGNFFCTGKQLEKFPLLAKKLFLMGHFIGNHSYSHTPFFPLRPVNQITSELQNTNTLIQKYTNSKSLYFRPPYGVCNPRIAQAVKGESMISIGWSIRSFDTQDHEGGKALNKIKRNLKSGDIILLHDHSPKILWILEELLNFIKDNNFNTQRIDKYFQQNSTYASKLY